MKNNKTKKITTFWRELAAIGWDNFLLVRLSVTNGLNGEIFGRIPNKYTCTGCAEVFFPTLFTKNCPKEATGFYPEAINTFNMFAAYVSVKLFGRVSTIVAV